MAVIHREYAQGTNDWLDAHIGIPTASEFKNLITDKWQIRAWSTDMPNTYLHRKLAEVWHGGLFDSGGGFATKQGNILEEKAIPRYALDYGDGIKVERVGFVTTDDGRIGCSPDLICGDDGGAEIKCPELKTHISYLLDGILPPEYAHQVHGSMLVTGRQWWDFYSYRLGTFPKFYIRVERDEDKQETLGDALHDFLERFDYDMARLIEINGGPPKKKERMIFADDIAAGRERDPDDVQP